LSSVLITVVIILLYLINSYCKTVVIDYLYKIGNFFYISSKSNGFGILLSKSTHLSFIIDSAEFPPPPADLGSSDKITSHYFNESLMAADIYALSCSPNTSGLSFNGKSFMKFL
jgi:hypothetical protein